MLLKTYRLCALLTGVLGAVFKDLRIGTMFLHQRAAQPFLKGRRRWCFSVVEDQDGE